MEGNEVEKAADSKQPDWKSLCNRLNAELTRTSKELDAMTTKYNELSQKYADLYKFAYGMAMSATKPKDSYLNEEI